MSYNYICCIALGTIDNRGPLSVYAVINVMAPPQDHTILGQHWLVSNFPVLGQTMLLNPFLLRGVY